MDSLAQDGVGTVRMVLWFDLSPGSLVIIPFRRLFTLARLGTVRLGTVVFTLAKLP